MPKAELRQFLLFVFALLVPCFALWSFLGATLITPVIGLAHLILSNWFPDIVTAVYQQGADALLMTRFDQVNGQLVAIDSADAGLGFSINTRIVSYSIPFYASLHFATARTGYLASFCWGLLLLYPFILLGLVSICLKDLMVNFGPRFLEQPGVAVPGADTIGIAYQLSVLIVPTLLPVMVWAWQNRDTALLRGLQATGAARGS
ncbi:MAG: exosortase H-associated membrane protein [Halieaceae bacterium]|jgi:hypothetical protein|nr:exosortase H-associated membrane protein [Halieaceae bacterium]